MIEDLQASVDLSVDLTEDIIVGVVFKGTFTWYVTYPSMWYMDAVKRTEDYVKAGYPGSVESSLDAERRGIAILDETNAGSFLEAIEAYRTTTEYLRGLLQQAYDSKDGVDPEDRINSLIDLVPALLINFDDRVLVSEHSENFPFERYAPGHWKAEYRDFTEDISNSNRYWVINNIDVFASVD